MLALVGARHIVHVSRIRVKFESVIFRTCRNVKDIRTYLSARIYKAVVSYRKFTLQEYISVEHYM